MTDKFHLGWFLNFRADPWSGPWRGTRGRDWTGEFYIDMARSLERAGFDYMMLEDSLMVSDVFAGTAQNDLKYALYAPKQDPMPLVPLLAKATEHIGIVATASTSFYPPYMLARLMATMDHLTKGRVGWNIVTSSEDRAAQNFGLDQLYEHDERYDRADEFFDVVCKLWDSWEPDAVIRDRESDTFADHTKVHPIEHEGQYFKVRGPLNVARSPQGRPVICQAGGSPRGREFASRTANTIIAAAPDIPRMKAYREDIRERMVKHGRKPDDCKILFVVSPVLGETTEEAIERKKRMDAPTTGRIERAIGHMSALTNIDFSQFDLDAPLPPVVTNGHTSTLRDFAGDDPTKTLRELAASWQLIRGVNLVGTPDDVAGQMEEVMQEVGGDGFLISGALNRRYISEIADGLAPALQDRGLIRTEYPYAHFRDNLLEF